jgi:hypothetical protein
MKSSSAFEQALRLRVREELRASPSSWEAYLQAQRVRGRRTQIWRVLHVVLLVLMVPGMLMMAAMFSVAFIGPGVIPGFVGRPEAQQGNGTELTLLLQAVCLTGLALLNQNDLWESLWRCDNLAAVAYYPLADAGYIRRVLVLYLLIGMACTPFALISHGYLAWVHGFKLMGWVAAVSLSLLQGAVLWAVLFLLLGRVPRMPASMLGLGLMVATLMVGLGGFLLRPWLEGWGWIGYALLPGGWVNGAFDYALVRGEPAGWLWLLPAIALLRLAVRRVPRAEVYREFVGIEAMPEPGCVALKGRWGPAPPAPARPTPGSPPRTRLALAGWDWSRLGWVERFVARLLTARERVVAEALADRPPRWTRWWWGLALATAVSTLCLALPVPASFAQMLTVPGVMTLALASVLIDRGPRGPLGAPEGTGKRGLPPLPCPWLPVSYREVAWCYLKVGFGLGFLLLPLAIVYGVLAAGRFGEPLRDGVAWGLKGVYVLWAISPAVLMTQFSATTNDTDTPLQSILASLLVVVVFSLFLALVFALVAGTVEAQVAAAILLPLLSGGVLYGYVRLLERGKLDWVRR